MSEAINLDIETVEGFGDEWTRFDQSTVPESERQDVDLRKVDDLAGHRLGEIIAFREGLHRVFCH